MREAERTLRKKVSNKGFSESDRRKQLINVVNRFESLPRTETSFYLEYARLSKKNMKLLEHFLPGCTYMEIFEAICRFYDVVTA